MATQAILHDKKDPANHLYNYQLAFIQYPTPKPFPLAATEQVNFLRTASFHAYNPLILKQLLILIRLILLDT